MDKMNKEQIITASHLWNIGWSAKRIGKHMGKSEGQIQHYIDRNRSLFPHKQGRIPVMKRGSRNPIRSIAGVHCQWETELGALVTLPMLSILRT